MIYNIRDFGAEPHAPAQKNKSAIQRAIDAAHQAGGGIVFVPAGTYATGTLWLKSHITLRIGEGAVLLGSTDHNDYDFTSVACPWSVMPGIQFPTVSNITALIAAEGAAEIAIDGRGTIDGMGQNHTYFPSPQDSCQRRPMLIFFDSCMHIRVEGISLRNPGKFAFLASRSNTIQIHGVRIESWETENGDGLDFNGSSDVTISDCIIRAGDDAISLKTTYADYACRNYTISNCVIESIWAAFRMGTESSGDMKDITISNCVFKNCGDGLKIQDCATGSYENIRISNIVMRDVHRPIFMTINSYRLSAIDTSYRPALGGIRDVWIDGVTAYMPPHGADYQRNETVISGTEQVKIQNLHISNSRFIFTGDPDPEAIDRVEIPEYLDYTFLYADVFSINGNLPVSGIFMRHIDGLRIANCDLCRQDSDPRPLLFAADVQNALLRDVHMRCNGDTFFHADSTIRLSGCEKNGFELAAPENPDERLLDRFHAFHSVSQKTDRMFTEMARAADEAERIGNYTLIDDRAWIKDGNSWFASAEIAPDAMLRIVSYGDVQVFVNNHLAGVCRIHPAYRNMIVWAVNAGKYACEGQNRIELRFDDVNDRGGADTLLPFGEFRPFRVGLCTPMRIYSKTV